ncbi:MAG: ribonuclease P protein component [Eubacteriales bacterium]|nr:ribonuclease P protein component [Eubacteriales bacterium]
MKFKAICENHLYAKAYAKGQKQVMTTVVVYVLRDYKAGLLQKQHPQKKRINRIGLTVTKKLGSAVQRNRVKRILREGYRALEKKTPVKKGYLIVLAARHAALRAKSTQIEQDLSKAFSAMGMLGLTK